MGELIFSASRTVELDETIARDAGQEDFVGNGIDGNEHIDVTEATGGKVAIGIIATDINREGFRGDVDIRMLDSGFGFNFDFNSIENLRTLPKIGGIFVDDRFMNGADEDGVKVAGK